MNSWSRGRKRLIMALVLLFLAVLVGLPMYLVLHRQPTCSDGKQDGDETGIDCGGSCKLVCSAESLPLILKGDPQILTVASSTYEVIALIENPNALASIYKASYSLTVYDASSTIPVKLYRGQAYVPKGSTFAVFEGPFSLDAGVAPARAVLEWQKDSLVWKKDDSAPSGLQVSGTRLSNESKSPRLEATLANQSQSNLSNIDLTAVISDEDGNVFAASKTYVDKLSAQSQTGVVFTWPRPFYKRAANIEILTRVFPDSTFLK